MFHSKIDLFGKSPDTWDTNCARKFLKIPEEELKKLGSNKGWSTAEQTNEHVSEQGEDFHIVEDVLSTYSEKTANPIDQSTNNTSEALADNSVSPLKKILKIPSTSKKQIFQSISLGRSKEVEGSPFIPEPENSTSIPDILLLEKGQSHEKLSTSLEDIPCHMSTEQSIISPFNKSSDQKLVFDTTYVIPSVLEDKTNDIHINSNIQSEKALSPGKITSNKRTFENLGTGVSNQPFLEEPSSPSVPKFGGLPVFPTKTVPIQVTRENFLSKKLRLLEKRFSPSKEFNLISPSKNPAMAEFKLKSIPQNMPKDVSQALEEYEAVKKLDSNLSAMMEFYKSSQKAIIKKKSCVVDMALSELPGKEEVKVASAVKPNTDVFEEESFTSQPIPCGQPPSTTQPYSSNKSRTQSSTKNVLPSVEGMSEKNIPLHVPSESCRDQVKIQESSIVKGSKAGRKRKFKSKNEKTSKKPYVAKQISIQYTDEQISNIIKIMKSEM